MFIVRLLRYLFGYVTFRATGNHVERLLDLLIHSDLRLWDSSVSENVFTACMPVRDYKKIRKVAKRCGAKVRIQKRCGLPFVLQRYRKRIGVLVGLVLFFLLLAVMSSFVWSIDIVGNESITEQEIMDNLHDLGVRPGVLKSGLDARKLEQQMILRIDKLSWIAINIEGSHVSVEINERIVPPTPIDVDQPCNVVAAKTGYITYMEVYNGQEILKVGDTVMEGELIVSGVIEDKKGQSTLTHARAKVIAQVSEQLEVKVSYQQAQELPIGEVVEKRYLEIFGFRIPLFLNKEVGPNYILETEERTLSILGISLPIRVSRERYQLTEVKQVQLSEQQAKEQALARLKKLEEERFSGGNIQDVQRVGIAGETEYVLTADYVCEQDIALQKEFYSGGPVH